MFTYELSRGPISALAYVVKSTLECCVEDLLGRVSTPGVNTLREVIQKSIFQDFSGNQALLGQKLTNGSKNGPTAPRTGLE
jgi:hypothetical protein